MAFVILLYILISWLANKDVKGLHNAKNDLKKAKFKILGRVRILLYSILYKEQS